MTSTRFFAAACCAGIATLGAQAAGATTLDFGSAGTPPVACVTASHTCSTYSRLEQSYGDIAGVIDVSTHAHDGGALQWWNTGYNELYGVAFNNASSVAPPAWVDLVPLNGASITLTHFDLGGYYLSQRHDVAVQVFDIGSGAALFSYLGNVGSGSGSGGVHSGFDVALVSTAGLRIQWADPAVAANVGIDNISYAINAPVPEPSTPALWLGGLAAVAWIGRRRLG